MSEANGTLMRKTKQELVNIILRKDDVANKLQKDLESLQRIIKTKSNSIDTKDERIIRLKEEVTKLNNVIKSRIEVLDDTKQIVQEKTKEIAELNRQLNDIKDGCDEYASQLVETTTAIRVWKNISLLIGSIALIVIVGIIGIFVI